MIFITWDESDFTGTGPGGFGDTRGCCDANPGGGHVLALTISHSDHGSRSSNVAYNHYSMLRTIEDGWHLGCLANTCDTANVAAMSDLAQSRLEMRRREVSPRLDPPLPELSPNLIAVLPGEGLVQKNGISKPANALITFSRKA